ncbi:hypothetical protein EDC14_100659 [Hydrogenispora ethanolica]|uniref:Uncharacterized protein n=1 Tax=Hydrogenispora ethanolica TaxID=1082276 RepID=A0A4R1S0B2_HYDET|nr:hypothetical protein [Hydrogenispora ethanolica]TCL72349.1 hypothetical protein EDC14_100659 [Hydrogenispora ethanolica]
MNFGFKTHAEKGSSLPSKDKPFITALFVLLVFGCGAIFLWFTVKNYSDWISWFCRITAIMLLLICMLFLVNLLPECKIKKILLLIFNIPLSLCYVFVKSGSIILGIITSIMLVFGIISLFFLILSNVFHIKIEICYFLSSLITLTGMAYFKSILPLALRILYLPKSDKKERQYRESIAILNIVNFRKLAYAISFILYILSIIDKYYGKTTINLDSIILVKDVYLESLIAFLTLDTCISNIAPKLIEKK